MPSNPFVNPQLPDSFGPACPNPFPIHVDDRLAFGFATRPKGQFQRVPTGELISGKDDSRRSWPTRLV